MKTDITESEKSMKLIGKFKEYTFTDKSMLIQFEVPKRYLQSIQRIDTEKLLELDIQNRKSQRSLKQNSYLWALIAEIDKHENRHTDKDSQMLLYINLIKMARVRIDYLQTIPEVLPTLENVFRYVKEIETRVSEKGVETKLYECYRGTSQFNQEEMSDFINVTIQYAESLDIDVTYYRDMLLLGQEVK